MFILKQTLNFDSDTRQWYKYICVCVCMCVCLCVYTWGVITLTIFWLGWLFVFVSIKSNSFDVKSNDFRLQKLWIYELLLSNIKQRIVRQSTISAHEHLMSFWEYWAFSEEIFSLSLAIVAVDINVETFNFEWMEFWCHNLLKIW